MAKAKAKKQAKGKPLFGGFPWFAWLLIALAIIGIVAFVRIFPIGEPSRIKGRTFATHQLLAFERACFRM